MSEVTASTPPSPSYSTASFVSNGSKKKNAPPSTPKPSPSSVTMSPNPLVDDDSPRKGRKESEQRRRVLMNQYYDELVILLSMISERQIPKKMDKASTLHEAVKCLRTYSELTVAEKKQTPKLKGRGGGKGASKVNKEVVMKGIRPDLISSGDMLQSFLDAHDTFLILISESGHILYATELITSLLGHMQTRLVGQNIYDYVPDVEKSTLMNMFNPGDTKPSMLKPPTGKVLTYPAQTFKCHFKMYSGETCNLTQHLPFCCVSYLRQWKETEEPLSPISPPLSPFDFNGGETESSPPTGTGPTHHESCVLLFGKLPTNLTLLDLPVGVNDVNFTFDMRVSKEGIIISIESHAVLVLGYTESELIGSRFFDYIDPYHLCDVGEHMATIFNSTRGTTNPYRFFTKGGRYVWLLSKGYLSYNPWNHKPDHILLSNRILGCDHVVPEFRFFRSRTLLPDLEGDELYNPLPLKDEAIASPPQNQPPSSQHHQQQSYNQQPSTGSSGQDNQPSVSLGRPLLHHTAERSSTVGNVKSEASLGNTHCRGQGNSVADLNIQQMGAQNIQQTGAQNIQQTGAQNIQQTGAQNIQQTGEGNLVTNLQQQQQQNSFMMNFRQEMEKKNSELFDMQRRLLEQQMLIEQERNQFYQVAQQVMQHIGTSSAPLAVPASLQLSRFTSQPGQTDTHKKQPSTSGRLQPSPSPLPTPHTKPPSTPSSSSTSPFPQVPYSGFPQSGESPPLSQLQLLQQFASKPAPCTSSSNNPYSLLMTQSSTGIFGHSVTSSLTQNHQIHNNPATCTTPISNPNPSTQSWPGLPAAMPHQQQLHQPPGQLGQQFQQPMSQQQKQEYGQHQLQMQQLPNSAPSGVFTPPTPTPLQLSMGPVGVHAALPQHSSISLPSNHPLLPATTLTTPSSFMSLPYQSLASQFKMTSLDPHPSLQTHPLVSTSDSVHAPSLSQPQSDISTGVSMRLPNDEEIQTLLDAMKCSNTSIPSTSFS